MSVVVRFQPDGLTRRQYEEVTRRIEAEWPPDGLQLHVLFGTDGDLKVSEIWESEERFRAFGERLLPVLNEVGVQIAGEPEVFEVSALDMPGTST